MRPERHARVGPARRASARTAKWLRVAVMFCACVACEFTETRRRRTSRLPGENTTDVQSGDGAIEVPRENIAGVVQLAPIDMGTTQCPGTRLLRVDRRWAANADAGSLAPLPPRYYGRDQYGRVVSLMEVLGCELRAMHFVEKGLPEGANLIMLRGARIADPDGDCEWREPWHTERFGFGDGGSGSRRVTVHEHCRRRGGGGGGEIDRVVTVEIPSTYMPIVIR